VEAQRAVMDGFFQRGRDNPAKVVTNISYRQHLVEAIVEDGLPFSLAEKGRSLRLFEHVVPRGVKARVSHQTVRRDIQALYDKLKSKLEA
jgi:hypothetical protein